MPKARWRRIAYGTASSPRGATGRKTLLLVASGLVLGLAAGALLASGSDRQDTVTVVEPSPAAAPEAEVAALPPTGQPDAPAPPVPAWRRNAVPVGAPRPPMLAVIIDDVGVDRRRSARAATLPAALTMAFLPYASDVETQIAAARASGHECILHVPMEPLMDGADPGPDALMVDESARDIAARLERVLALGPECVGVSNHMGSRFTQDRDRMATVLGVLRNAGLVFVDSRTHRGTVAAKEAERARVPFVERDVFLDNERDPSAIRDSLAKAEAVARERGHAVAIGHPYDETIAVLRAWLPAARGRGLAIVPVSAVIEHRLRTDAMTARR